MRNSRIISQSLSRCFTPTSKNLTHQLPQSFSLIPTFRIRNSTLTGLFSDREFTSEAKVGPSERVSAIVDEISGLTLLELSDLTEVLMKKLGIKEMPMMGVMMPGMGFGMTGAAKGGGAAKAEEKVAEKTAFDLKLEGGFDASAKIKIIKEVRACTDLGLKEAKDVAEKTAFDLKLEGGFDASAKIKIIKEVRACTDLGLKEAKDLVEKAPTLLKKGVNKEEAEKIIAKLKEVGAKVTMD